MQNNENNQLGNAAEKTAYMMVQMTVKSLEDLNERYGQFVFPILHKYKGQMIAGSATPIVKEGEWDGNWAAVLRFPSLEAAEQWYNSEEYQPLKALRMNEMQVDAGRIVMIEGL